MEETSGSDLIFVWAWQVRLRGGYYLPTSPSGRVVTLPLLKAGLPQETHSANYSTKYMCVCVCAGRCRKEQLQRAPYVFVHLWAS